MNKLHFAPAVIGLIIGVIVLISVGLSVTSGAAASLSNPVVLANETLTTAGTGTTAQLTTFTGGTCASGLVIGRLDNTTTMVPTLTSNYTYDANTGIITFVDWNTALYGTSARVSASSCDATDATTQTIVGLVPLFVALGTLVYVAAQVMM